MDPQLKNGFKRRVPLGVEALPSITSSVLSIKLVRIARMMKVILALMVAFAEGLVMRPAVTTRATARVSAPLASGGAVDDFVPDMERRNIMNLVSAFLRQKTNSPFHTLPPTPTAP